MEVISILFRKSFLLKNKIFFLSNIYEDILYSFKCHFYNNIKIYFFSKAIYLKKKILILLLIQKLIFISLSQNLMLGKVLINF